MADVISHSKVPLPLSGHRCRLLSPSRPFSSKSEKTLTSRCTYSKTGHGSVGRLTNPETQGTVSAAQGRNRWARERVKAHTQRCREHHITRQNIDYDTRSRDSMADGSFHGSDDLPTDAEKMLIAELTVDTTLVGSGSTPKSSPASFSDAFRGNIPLEVKKLIVCHATGETVLHKAARLGYEDIVQWCCRTGYVSVNSRDNAGYTPLHGSCIGGHISISRCLIEYGADVNAASRLDGARPLHDAVDSDCIEIVRLLLAAGADINLTTYSGKTVESLACSHDMRAFLRAHSIDVNGSQRDYGTDVDWHFLPSWNDPSAEDGYDVLANPPLDCDEEPAQKIVFEGSQQPFLPIYFLQLDKMRQSENFLQLRDVLQRVGMKREKFMSTYAEEVIIHEIGQRTSDHRTAAADDEDLVTTKSSTTATRVEFVRMSDVIRRLLNIDISLVSTVDRDAITRALHL